MEEVKEKSSRKPLSMRLSASTSERFQYVIDLYRNPEDPKGEQQENAILRILSIAESDDIRGTHPELEGPLRAVQDTISTLIKQINGIAVGQDSKISNLQEELNSAIAEKEQILEQAQSDMDKAKQKADLADRLSSEAVVSIKRAEENAASEIEAAKKEAAAQIEKITSERDHAFRERDDARMLAQEKTASNDLLLKQMTDMEADLSAYKTLQQQYKELLEKYNTLQVQLKEKEMKAELDKERAVMAKEREMQDLLRQADRETAKLQAKIEQLSSIENPAK